MEIFVAHSLRWTPSLDNSVWHLACAYFYGPGSRGFLPVRKGHEPLYRLLFALVSLYILYFTIEVNHNKGGHGFNRT